MAIQLQTLAHPSLFLHDILDQPHDDEPRLRYAAWLEDQGEPLGEFIQVQCRLSVATEDHQGLAWEWERREQELLAENEQEWAGDVRGLVDWWTFRRGFIEEIAADATRLLQHAEHLFEHAPIVELHLSRARERLEALTHCRWLAGLQHLDLSNNFVRDQGAELVALSPYLSELHSLNLSSAALGDGAARTLGRSPYLKKMRELYLCDNRIGAAGCRALAFSPLADQLDLLHLRNNNVDVASAALLKDAFGDRVHL